MPDRCYGPSSTTVVCVCVDKLYLMMLFASLIHFPTTLGCKNETSTWFKTIPLFPLTCLPQHIQANVKGAKADLSSTFLSVAVYDATASFCFGQNRKYPDVAVTTDRYVFLQGAVCFLSPRPAFGCFI